MKNVERLQAALKGEDVDRIPFTADLAWWYGVNKEKGSLPKCYEGMSLLEIAKDIGVIVEIYPNFYRIRTGDVERVENRESVYDERGLLKKCVSSTTFKTPIGKLRETKVQTSSSESQYTVEHPVKNVEDMRTMRYILDHSSPEPIFDEYAVAARKYGDHGSIQMTLPRSPIQKLLIEAMGYKNAFIALRTHPKEAGELMLAMERLDDEIYRMAEGHPANVWEFGENIHCEITNPRIFRGHNMPYYERRTRQLHAHGKMLYLHLDGYMRTLLPLLGELGFDAIQGFAPSPQGDFTITELRGAVGGKMRLWGGIPATILCEGFSEEYVRDYVLDELKAISPGDGFIMAIGDMLPPNGDIRRISLIETLLEKYGCCPLSIR